jgi:hypothetical protein
MEANAPNTAILRPVLVIHAAIAYTRGLGLGIGLVQRAACAGSGRTRKDVLKTRCEGRKIAAKQLVAPSGHLDGRADMFALLAALEMAHKAVRLMWSKTLPATTAVILLGRPCDDVLNMVRHHVEHEPRSLNSLCDADRAVVRRIVRQIHVVRRHGFNLKIAMSKYEDGRVQTMAAKKAEQKLRRLCHGHDKKQAAKKEIFE